MANNKGGLSNGVQLLSAEVIQTIWHPTNTPILSLDVYPNSSLVVTSAQCEQDEKVPLVVSIVEFEALEH